jgi:mRNA-degrading endonuclease toxin of MazEF toxin-antitoxin module
VELPRVRFLREQSYANVQGIQAIQFHELQGPVGRFTAPTMEAIRDALRYAMDL